MFTGVILDTREHGPLLTLVLNAGWKGLLAIRSCVSSVVVSHVNGTLKDLRGVQRSKFSRRAS